MILLLCLVNFSTSEVQFKDYFFFETFLTLLSPSLAGIIFPIWLCSHSTICNFPVALNNFYCIICTFVFSLGLCALWIPNIYLIHLCHVKIVFDKWKKKKQWTNEWVKEWGWSWVMCRSCINSSLLKRKVTMRDIKVVTLLVEIYRIPIMLQPWWLLSMHYHYTCNIHSQ